LSRRLPIGARFGVLATLAVIASLIGGAVYVTITIISFAIFGGRMLVYPGVLGGMCTGYLLFFFKKNLALSTGAFVVIVALGAGLIVLLSRWWFAARLGDVGLITYLFEYASVR